MQVYAAIRDELATGGRVYIVCPLVSESSSDALAGVKAAEEEHERLISSRVFDAHGCGLLHGKMKQDEKQAVLAKFNRYVAAGASFARVWKCLCTWCIVFRLGDAAWQDAAAGEGEAALAKSPTGECVARVSCTCLVHRLHLAHGCGLLHGKMKQQEREAVLAKFKRCVATEIFSFARVLSHSACALGVVYFNLGMMHGKMQQEEKQVVLAKFNRYAAAGGSFACVLMQVVSPAVWGHLGVLHDLTLLGDLCVWLRLPAQQDDLIIS
jgi:hypothetical protein